ncbi:MAG: M20/M25/M40 family metallo-hydrolase [Christensenellales bacterium]|nr:M20/M25/M40 family metallo-hydrolase [Christensenellales bacterium]
MMNREQYALEVQQELKQLIRELCAIPAPSYHEEKRAEFCKRWFEENGAEGVYIDEALNVICPWGVTGENDLIAVLAHMDTVFPDMEPLPFEERDGKMFCPAVGDNTANLAVMMLAARYVMRHCTPGKTGVLFVANTCEEGLGNLKGCRKVVDAFSDRIRSLISVDYCSLRNVINGAVGSRRYRVEVLTEGGHSDIDFGKRNAVHAMAEIICDLYAVEIPVREGMRISYNVGTIAGGTAVNSIAQKAEMLYEYRSNHEIGLKDMEKKFTEVIQRYRDSGLEVRVELLGDRPCAGKVDPDRMKALNDWIGSAIRETLGVEPQFGINSTDCNYPLSLGIPAVCIGACQGKGAHTREEWLDVESLKDGMRLVLSVFEGFLEK